MSKNSGRNSLAFSGYRNRKSRWDDGNPTDFAQSRRRIDSSRGDFHSDVNRAYSVRNSGDLYTNNLRSRNLGFGLDHNDTQTRSEQNQFLTPLFSYNQIGQQFSSENPFIYQSPAQFQSSPLNNNLQAARNQFSNINSPNFAMPSTPVAQHNNHNSF